ncbi:phage tail protein [Luteimonas sp. M1R5S18]|uniref:Phage tail protein n=1 Tax=Luteimonas rhizosphaericola TaxID=3042024 RepID=A0ABT6JNB7_9GAMM|nr:phage tail protein [Luteimonas rhizosphaericola]MDH5832178.1 phage tail protein [Luteimonas rhizosphaericola]
MGSSKKQTVSYWYHPFFQLALHEGPFDKLLKIRGGDVDAWVGELTASGSITVDAPNLWGGDEKEGGIQGTFDVMFGEMDAEPNVFFQTAMGPDPSNHNGVALLQFNSGRYGAGNPYPKAISVLTERIYEGWLDDVCWYPEKAKIVFESFDLPYDGIWAYQVEAPGSTADYSSADYDHSGWATGPGGFGSNVPPGSTLAIGTFVGGLIGRAVWIRREITFFGELTLAVFHDDGAWLWVDGVPVEMESLQYFHSRATVNVLGKVTVALKVLDGIPAGSTNIFAGIAMEGQGSEFIGMNPAHVIYDSLTNLQGEPIASIDEASFTAAADRLYLEGFGICTKYNHAQETIEQFRQRILDLIGAECSRYNGRWYLDLIRELSPAEIDALPILTDDDILDWQEDPTNRDDAVNQVAVKWFDPDTKQSRITPHVHALAAINTLGCVNPEVREYPEVPYEALANRLALRDLHNKSTPTRRFNQTTNRKPYNWRKGHAFRLQSPKRGIADMVCRVADIDRGTLQSGAIRLVAVQDIFAMPATVYVTGEPSVPAPSPIPEPMAHQVLFEAPYVELAGVLSAGDLAALDADAGFILATGVKPGNGQGYALLTRPVGGEFERIGTFDWCPSAIVVEGAGYTDTGFTLAGGSLLARVEVGTAALWGSELVRVVALDLVTGAAEFGRGVGDTVAVKHAPGERIYFFDAWAATDQVEYATAETVEAKLLPRTGTQERPAEDVTALEVTLGQRAARPYPPAKFRINGLSDPEAVVGDVVATWAHRDRVAQADQLFDAEVDSVGPEAGTTYTLRAYLNDALADEQTGITGTTATWVPEGAGLARVEVVAVRDGLESWQAQVREFSVGAPLLAEDDSVVTTETDQPIIME